MSHLKDIQHQPHATNSKRNVTFGDANEGQLLNQSSRSRNNIASIQPILKNVRGDTDASRKENATEITNTVLSDNKENQTRNALYYVF